MRYLMATLTDGTRYISGFQKLDKVQKYIGEVFGGVKPFNIWKPVGDTLPSGEKNMLRTRKFLNKDMIREIDEVEPIPDSDGASTLNPDQFRSIVYPTRGARGLWTVPHGLQNSLIPGTVYPLHRDALAERDYIIVRGATERDEEDRYWIDGLGANGHRRSPGQSIRGQLPGTQQFEEEDEF